MLAIIWARKEAVSFQTLGAGGVLVAEGLKRANRLRLLLLPAVHIDEIRSAVGWANLSC